MPGAIFIEGERVNLRTVEEEDLEFLRDYYNHPDIRTEVLNPKPANLKQEQDFFENIVSSDESLQLLICLDEEPIGMAGIEKTKDQGAGELGIWLKPGQQGNGYGPEAAELILDHALNQLRFHKIFARVKDDNEPSHKVWQRLGFREEGVLKEHSYQDGEYFDVHLYGVTEDEWRE